MSLSSLQTPTHAEAYPERMTREAFRQLPEGPPYYELHDGVLIKMARPRRRHQKISLKLSVAIDNYLKENPIGELWPEVEVDLAPTITYVPDLSFLKNENLDHFKNEVSIDGPPDLVIEILSPSTRSIDVTRKLWVYQQTGVMWYWIVDPETLVVQVFKNSTAGYLIRQSVELGQSFETELFPGLEINLAALMGEHQEGGSA